MLLSKGGGFGRFFLMHLFSVIQISYYSDQKMCRLTIEEAILTDAGVYKIKAGEAVCEIKLYVLPPVQLKSDDVNCYYSRGKKIGEGRFSTVYLCKHKGDLMKLTYTQDNHKFSKTNYFSFTMFSCVLDKSA